MDLLEVDKYGLDQTDRRILETMIAKFSGGPVGLGDAGSRDWGGFRHDRGRL